MKNTIVVYPAIFTHYDDETGKYFVVEFPDLSGCITDGETIREAYYMAQDALGLYLDDFAELPKPTLDISKIKLGKNQFVSFVSLDIEEYRKKVNSKAVKKTLTIPCWLNTLAEKEGLNFSQILQDALKEKLNIDY